MKSMKYHLIRDRIAYTGLELKSHWIMDTTGVVGDAIVAFQGAADVPTDHMVDLMDVRDNAPIWSKHMLHFIAEMFGASLEEAVREQRLLIAIVAEELRQYPKASKIRRIGDDIYDGKRKLSVSIAAKSPVSCCIHAGLNVDAEGAPVAAVGLADYGVDATRFAMRVMKRFTEEYAQMSFACAKVRPIP